MHALLIFGFLCMNILLHIFMECVGISSCKREVFIDLIWVAKTDVCQRGSPHFYLHIDVVFVHNARLDIDCCLTEKTYNFSTVSAL